MTVASLQNSLQILLSDDLSFPVDYVNADPEDISEKDVPVFVNYPVTAKTLNQVAPAPIQTLKLFLDTNYSFSSYYDDVLGHSVQLLYCLSFYDVKVDLV